MREFLTSDTHFEHANIIKYSGRPFSSVEEMDEQLIDNINNNVGVDDHLYHIGDFARYDIEKFRKAIKCKHVILITGNHDRRLKSWHRNLFEGVYAYYELTTEVENQKIEIMMFHYACRVWNKSHHGTYHAYGHSHASLPEDPHARSMDVGVDSIARKLSPDGGKTLRPEDYRPISVLEFHNWMKVKEWKPVDHHRGGHIDTSFAE